MRLPRRLFGRAGAGQGVAPAITRSQARVNQSAETADRIRSVERRLSVHRRPPVYEENIFKLFRITGCSEPVFHQESAVRSICVRRNGSSAKKGKYNACPRCHGTAYFLNSGADTLFPAKVFGPGFDREKYIFAAFVVPKSRLEPLSWTSLKASRNI